MVPKWLRVEKSLYSRKDYKNVVLGKTMYFAKIEPTEHCLLEHQHEVPWERVVQLILTTKNPRRKGEKYEIERDGWYVLFEIKENVLYVINAKRP